ncbi:SNase-domain-containing protein [Trametes meyenii]|nr:SNase-domain-containing protein [Trametes meyenii]
MPSWIPFWGSNAPDPSDPRTNQQASDSPSNTPIDSGVVRDAGELIASIETRVAGLPSHLLILSAFAVGGATALGGYGVYVRHFRRIRNGEWVTPEMLKKRRRVKGYVTSVGDADNFRLYHTPGVGWRWPLKFRRIPSGRTGLKDETIHIRIAGVDAPEASHFGRPPQPFAEESLAWLKSQVQGRFVYCELVRKDQFGRIVSAVHLKPRLLPGWLASGRDLSIEMLRAGWGSVYEQAGAEYGKSGLAKFLRIQKEAQSAKRGIWKHGTKGETPAEYKRRYREAPAAGDAVPPAQSTPQPTLRSTSEGGWWKRLFRSRAA